MNDDAIAVGRLKAAGALVLGKTNGPFSGPLTVTLAQPGGDFAASGLLASCVPDGTMLVCRWAASPAGPRRDATAGLT